MKEIQLTQGMVCLVDDWNYESAARIPWTADKHRNTWYAKVFIKGHGNVYLHRLVMQTPDDLEVDHLDGNGLNCQEANMRNCTRSENAQNQKHKKKWTGVYYDKRNNRIFSSICINYRSIYLGNFDTEKEAAIAYNEAALKYYGAHAKLNIVE